MSKKVQYIRECAACMSHYVGYASTVCSTRHAVRTASCVMDAKAAWTKERTANEASERHEVRALSMTHSAHAASTASRWTQRLQRALDAKAAARWLGGVRWTRRLHRALDAKAASRAGREGCIARWTRRLQRGGSEECGAAARSAARRLGVWHGGSEECSANEVRECQKGRAL